MAHKKEEKNMLHAKRDNCKMTDKKHPSTDNEEGNEPNSLASSGPRILLWTVLGLCVNVVLTCAIMNLRSPPAADTVHGWGPLGLRGLSHVSINVQDIDQAIEFYHRVLGYEVMNAGRLWGDFDMRGLHNEAFCKDAGFMDGHCLLDAVWMKHPYININLELFQYHEPGNKNYLLKEKLPDTHDIGGVKHIAYAVENADVAFEFLKSQPDVQFISDDPNYKPIRMEPFPFKFFYWRDPYGVQWECEEGDKIVTRQISSVTRLMDDYIEFK